ncbi:MAG TPA: twin-arginine translocation signal domain-containing protein [Prolixibacteraceae bacterium]|nr:twin-arginine translocation signal domain-containing protein [Prolixibacteraceae bacterium]
MTSKQIEMNENAACSSRRNFIKGTAMVTSALALQGWVRLINQKVK